MRLRLLRHATLRITLADRSVLVDPMLSEPEVLPPIEDSPNDRRNPMVPLPDQPGDVVAGIDAILLTHTHTDHWDEAATEMLPPELPLFCQPADGQALAEQGFSDIRPLEDREDWDGMAIVRTGGQHGTGEIGEQMGPVSGYVLAAPGEPTLYVTGDTIWCPEVAAALAEHRPAVVVVSAGAAQLVEGDPITMTAEDVLTTARTAAEARVVAVHMGAINHCLLTRSELGREVEGAGVADRVEIPVDGEELVFA